MRRREDRRTLGVLLSYAVAVVTLWVSAPTGAPLWLGVALACVLSWLCAVVAHNVVHLPVFRSRALNRAFQVWVSLSYGFPVSEFVPGHNLSHHRFTQQAEDVMRTTRLRFRWNLLNLLGFFFVVAPRVTTGNYRYAAVTKAKNPQWWRQLQLEIALVWGVKAGLLLLDWKKCLLLVVVPHLFAVWGITTVNFLWHDGCDESHPYNHSRNFTGRLFNWVTLNNGFHAMHHEQPGLHWADLPAAHAERLSPHIHPALEQRSLPVYLWKTFVWPGRRSTYDGKPLEPADVGDRDWVSASP